MRLSSISLALTRLGQRLGRWSPLALWPDGISTPGMWSSPSTLPASFNDSTGTTPVATPGTVADSANPVGLALDIRAGAPDTLGPELVTNGDFSAGTTGWTLGYMTPAISVSSGQMSVVYDGGAYGRVTAPITCVVGRMYQVSMSLVSSTGPVRRSVTENSAGVAEVVFSDSTTPGVWTAIFTATQTTLWACVGLQGASSGQEGVFANISVREIPGHHMLQATSAARPLESARVNLLTYTEDFLHDVVNTYITVSPAETTGPFGDNDGWKFTEGATGSVHATRSNTLYSFPAGQVLKRTGYFKQGSAGRNVQFGLTYGGDSFGGVIDLSSGTLVAGSTGAGTTISSTVTLVNGWYECTVEGTMGASLTGAHPYEALSNLTAYNDTMGPWYAGDGTSFVYAFGRDLRAASVASSIPSYQSVPGNGSTYSSTGITPFQLYDGTDDGMATASFAAGTLINGMDCLIAVRRDSAANAVCGLYESVAEANKVFGIAESGSSSGCVGSGAGTPTVWVDGAQLTGGTAVTRGTLHTALSAGNIHILEFRGLDLSTWTASGFGLYTSYKLLGARGDIMLFPSPADATERDKARQYLADKYGVTLP